MLKPLPSGNDNSKKKKDNGITTKFNKKKKIKSWNSKDSKKSRNNNKSRNTKKSKPSKVRKSSLTKSGPDKSKDLKPVKNKKEKHRFSSKK
jgi:hypothetical protein